MLLKAFEIESAPFTFKYAATPEAGVLIVTAPAEVFSAAQAMEIASLLSSSTMQMPAAESPSAPAPPAPDPVEDAAPEPTRVEEPVTTEAPQSSDGMSKLDARGYLKAAPRRRRKLDDGSPLSSAQPQALREEIERHSDQQTVGWSRAELTGLAASLIDTADGRPWPEPKTEDAAPASPPADAAPAEAVPEQESTEDPADAVEAQPEPEVEAALETVPEPGEAVEDEPAPASPGNGELPKELKHAQSLRAVVAYFMGEGITDPAEILAQCEAIKEDVPALQRVRNLNVRVPGIVKGAARV